jgi:hypothetical protein
VNFFNTGNHDIPVGESATIFVAVAYGTDLAALQTQIVEAQNTYNQIFTSIDIENQVPTQFSLGQNYPNPFNPSTTIPVTLENSADVNLQIFNILGQQVVTLYQGKKTAGEHQFSWNGQNSAGKLVQSGIYFYRLQIKDTKGQRILTRKMILSK